MTDQEIIKMLKISPGEKVLDVGGAAKQHTEIAIDTLADICRPEDFPYYKSKLKAKRFAKLDITTERMPFKDREFDMCLCTHTLEDLTNPKIAIEEMSRVAKRGIIVTPSRGKDMEYSHYNLTDWMTGGRRTPGIGHHRWLFENIGNALIITTKNYPLLYTPEFMISKWNGEEECVYAWKNKISYKMIDPLSHHELIYNYREFMKRECTKIHTGRILFYLDNPIYYIKEQAKALMKRGSAFKN